MKLLQNKSTHLRLTNFQKFEMQFSFEIFVNVYRNGFYNVTKACGNYLIDKIAKQSLQKFLRQFHATN